METARLMLGPRLDGFHNMAVDEFMMLQTLADGRPILRFYQWATPTLSLGYFQEYLERTTHTASLDCPCVRRHSGGGAILHDQELTYSLSIHASNRVASYQLYTAVHSALIDVCRQLGVTARLSTVDQPVGFLCFQRRSQGDILLDDWKIAGSAQRRHRTVTLQHGSLLLRRSSSAPELPGIEDVGGNAIDDDQLIRECSRQIGDRLRMRLVEQPMNPVEQQKSSEIAAEKFGRQTWTRRR